jgi:hypothetical protein
MTNPVTDYSPLGGRGFPIKGEGTQEQKIYQQPTKEVEDDPYASLGGRDTVEDSSYSNDQEKSLFQYLTPIGQKFKEKYLSPKEGFESEGTGKALFRSLLQLPLGIVSKYLAPLEMLQPGIIQESLDDMEEYAIRNNLSEDEYNKLIEGVYEGANYLGTQAQAENYIEEKTGTPLRPHTRGQELARLGSFAGSISKSIPAALGAPLLSETLQEKTGLNSEASDMLSLMASGVYAGGKAYSPLRQGAKQGVKAIGQAGKELAPQIVEGAKALKEKAVDKINSPAQKKLSPSEKIVKFAVNEDIRPDERSTYGTAKEILNNLREEENQRLLSEEKPKEFRYPRPSAANENPAPLKDRVNVSDQQIGLRPTGSEGVDYSTSFKNKILKNISEREVYNDSNFAQGVQNEVQKVNDIVRTGLNELYDEARELNQGIQATYTRLPHELLNFIEDPQNIPARGANTNQLIKKTEDIIDRLATVERNENGDIESITGYKPISNQTLIDQMQELRELIDLPYIEGKSKNKFLPIIGQINSALENTARANGNGAAIDALQNANAAFSTWAQYFDNQYVNPFRRRSEGGYESLYKKAVIPDGFMALQDVLNQSTHGRELVKALQREIVNDKLEPYFKNPRNIPKEKLDKTLRNLEPIIGEREVEDIRKEFNSYARRYPNRFRIINKIPEGKVNKDLKAVSRVLEKTPEQIEANFNSRSGIQDLRERLSNNETNRNLFKKLQDQKILDILYEGKVKKTPTGKELSNVLNDRHNFELLSEMVGEEEAKAMRRASEALGNRIFTKQNIKTLGETTGKIILKGKIYHLVRAFSI